jgi:hypothetical protein
LIVSNHADLDLDEEDERTDLPASPQDADLEDGGGDLDDMARPKSTPSIAPTRLATPACSKRAARRRWGRAIDAQAGGVGRQLGRLRRNRIHLRL